MKYVKLVAKYLKVVPGINVVNTVTFVLLYVLFKTFYNYFY